MALLQPTGVPSRSAINAAITSEIANHASTTDTTGQHYDSGWVTIPLVSPFLASGGETPSVRRIGKLVLLRGRVAGAVAAADGNKVVANMPAGFLPPMLNMVALVTNSATINGRLWVATNGAVTVNVGSTISSFSITMSYYID